MGCRLVYLETEWKYDEEVKENVPNIKLISFYENLGFQPTKIKKKNKTVLFFDLKGI